MHPHAELIETFYTAFQRRDGDAMADCYHPEIRFSDPVFTDLRGDRAGGMWQMLTGRAKDLTVEYSDVYGDDDGGRAHWDASYTFSATGRHVDNHIDATFRFRDGKIVEHHDTFSLWAWSRQALGVPGLLLGWSGIIQGKVRATAGASLDAFMAKRG
ncbi:MAG: nuclear transport factor 2 family protein [Deltaproteobacteria bacterium]|nr:nuclear transport factor 2 family protein [Deltaproteobacteria bacterium]